MFSLLAVMRLRRHWLSRLRCWWPIATWELLLREALGETIEEPPAWQGWRAEQVMQPLRETAASLVAGTVTGKQ
jgi:hypothetical protein